MITGKIEEVSTKCGNGPKGDWTRRAFKIDGKSYSTFDAVIGGKFKAGDVVTMTGEQKGQYWNMQTMVLASEQPIGTSVVETSQDATNTETNDLLRQILAELKNGNSKE